MYILILNDIINLLYNTLKIIALHKITSNARKLFVYKAWFNATKSIVCASLSFEIFNHLFSFECFILLSTSISFILLYLFLVSRRIRKYIEIYPQYLQQLHKVTLSIKRLIYRLKNNRNSCDIYAILVLIC